MQGEWASAQAPEKPRTGPQATLRDMGGGAGDKRLPQPSSRNLPETASRNSSCVLQQPSPWTPGVMVAGRDKPARTPTAGPRHPPAAYTPGPKNNRQEFRSAAVITSLRLGPGVRGPVLPSPSLEPDNELLSAPSPPVLTTQSASRSLSGVTSSRELCDKALVTISPRPLSRHSHSGQSQT